MNRCWKEQIRPCASSMTSQSTSLRSLLRGFRHRYKLSHNQVFIYWTSRSQHSLCETRPSTLKTYLLRKFSYEMSRVSIFENAEWSRGLRGFRERTSESILPILHCLHLILSQSAEIVQRSVKILCQHVLVKATTCQTSTGISSSEILVGSTRTVEILAGCNIEDLASYRQIYGHVLLAIVWLQHWWGKRA